MKRLWHRRSELLDENRFHGLEATKGVAQRIRDLTGLGCDGTDLVTQALLGRTHVGTGPLNTESEK